MGKIGFMLTKRCVRARRQHKSCSSRLGGTGFNFDHRIIWVPKMLQKLACCKHALPGTHAGAAAAALWLRARATSRTLRWCRRSSSPLELLRGRSRPPVTAPVALTALRPRSDSFTHGFLLVSPPEAMQNSTEIGITAWLTHSSVVHAGRSGGQGTLTDSLRDHP
jgi:hypothetical protein